MKSKKKGIGVLNGSFESYTRYSDILELMMKSKKKVLGALNGSF